MLSIEENTIKDYQHKLQQGLKASRYQHSLSVAETAEKLARRWGADPKQAYLAGLLHDAGRIYPPEQLLEKAKEYGLELDSWHKSKPQLLHAPVGALLLEKEWGIHDPVLLQAVARHTLAGEHLTLLDKILYLADVIEPLRTSWPGLEQLRQLGETDLNRAMLAALAYSFTYLAGKQEKPHPCSIQAYQQLMENDHGGTTMNEKMDSQTMLELAVAAAQEKKAAGLTSLELKGITTIADYFLIMSVSNTRLAQALADHLTEKLKEAGAPPLRTEGYRDGRWILLDMGSLVIHIFQNDEREYYNLEKLWADAPSRQYND